MKQSTHTYSLSHSSGSQYKQTTRFHSRMIMRRKRTANDFHHAMLRWVQCRDGWFTIRKLFHNVKCELRVCFGPFLHPFDGQLRALSTAEACLSVWLHHNGNIGEFGPCECEIVNKVWDMLKRLRFPPREWCQHPPGYMGDCLSATKKNQDCDSKSN